MSDYLDRCVELRSCTAEFMDAPDMTARLVVAEKAARCHMYLHHYTTIPNVLKMLHGGCMYLTRSDSVSLDDNQEHRKYGTKAVAEKTYMACFDAIGGESAAMWGLYCNADRFAVRLAIPCDVVAAWINEINVRRTVEIAEMFRGHHIPEDPKLTLDHAILTDLLYADVKGDSVGEKSRKNALYLHDASMQISDLSTQRHSPEVTGRVKDWEWRFEEESRFLIRVADNCKYVKKVKVPLTKEWVKGLSFTLSPWMDEADKRNLTKMLRDAVLAVVHKESKIGVYKSNLSTALKRWEIDRRKRTGKMKCSTVGSHCKGRV